MNSYYILTPIGIIIFLGFFSMLMDIVSSSSNEEEIVVIKEKQPTIFPKSVLSDDEFDIDTYVDEPIQYTE